MIIHTCIYITTAEINKWEIFHSYLNARLLQKTKKRHKNLRHCHVVNVGILHKFITHVENLHGGIGFDIKYTKRNCKSLFMGRYVQDQGVVKQPKWRPWQTDSDKISHRLETWITHHFGVRSFVRWTTCLHLGFPSRHGCPTAVRGNSGTTVTFAFSSEENIRDVTYHRKLLLFCWNLF